MNYWLLKTEPTVYSYDDLVRDKKAVWDGVANPAALVCIRNARKGDQAFIYHTGDEKQIVGIAEIVSDPYQDPKQDNEKLMVFEVKPLEKLQNPVTLTQVKAIKKYADFTLVRDPRKSVQQVPKEYWDDFVKMSE